MIINIHIKFAIEYLNKTKITDAEIDNIVDFIFDANENLPLCGKSKLSSNTVDQKQKKFCDTYQIWHYHIGHNEKCIKKNCPSKENCVKMQNSLGFTSSAILHLSLKNYSTIFGYSKEHTNNKFPKLYHNPYLQRIKTLENTTTLDEVENFKKWCEENAKDLTFENFISFQKTLNNSFIELLVAKKLNTNAINK